MSRPTRLLVNNTLYWVMRIYNPANGTALIDADSTPTVAVRKNGAAVADSVTVTKRAATTGIYDCSYNPAGEVEGDQFTIEESAVIGGTTYQNSWEMSVVHGNARELIRTTIATLDSQTSFTLTAGSADNDAYNGCVIVIEDALTAVQKAHAFVSDYVGASRTVTLLAAPGFTVAANDRVIIHAQNLAGTSQDFATALLDLENGIEDDVTLRQAIRGIAAVIVGLIPSGAGTNTEAFKGIGQGAGGTTRVTNTVDGAGNRTAQTLNL